MSSSKKIREIELETSCKRCASQVKISASPITALESRFFVRFATHARLRLPS